MKRKMTTITGETLKLVVDGINKNDGNALTSNNIQTALSELDNIVEQLGTTREKVKSLRHILMFAKEEKWTEMNKHKSDGVRIYHSLVSQQNEMKNRNTNEDISTKQKQKTTNDSVGLSSSAENMTSNGNKPDQYQPKERTRKSDIWTIDELRKKDEEIEALKNRLSRYAGDRLRDGNASITDLSDKNRPIKLAEYFSELYDNEWTDAFNHLQTGGNAENVVVKTLLQLLKTTYDYSQSCAEKQRHILMQSLLHPSQSDPPRSKQHFPQSDEVQSIMRMVKQIQKDSAEFAVINLRKDFFSQYMDRTYSDPHVKPYIYKCLQLTWLFSVQDPPLCLLWDKEGDSRKDHLRPYTKQGTRIDFLVWPTLLLHDNGPVLSKGVAQFK